MTRTSPPLSPQGKARANRALVATYFAFIAAGIFSATWASRIPQIKIALNMDPASWGFVLLSMALGSITALPVAGLVIRRFGEKRVVQGAAIISGLAVSGIGIGYLGGPVPVVVSLYIFGLAFATWDVAMNVQGSAVEYRLGHAIMPRFHAGFSVGTVIGALLGAVLIYFGVGITFNLVAVGILLGAAVVIRVRDFLSGVEDVAEVASIDAQETDTFIDPQNALTRTPEPKTLTLRQAWTEPRTLLVGLTVLIFAFTEGTALDWIGVALVEDRHTSVTVGTLGLAMFLTTMTLSRWFGTTLLDRYGRVVVLRVQSVVGLIGVAIFVFSGNVALAFLGVALWGFGASLGFPVGMSAGGDDQKNSAVRVSVIATIGYTAFLAGPPLIGLVGQHVGVLRAVMLTGAALPIAFLIAGATGKPEGAAAPGQTS